MLSRKAWLKVESVALVAVFINISEYKIAGVNRWCDILYEHVVLEANTYVVLEAKNGYAGDWN
jgi:hypothetical protein